MQRFARTFPLLVAVVVAGCAVGEKPAPLPDARPAAANAPAGGSYGSPPPAPAGSLDARVQTSTRQLVATFSRTGTVDRKALTAVARSRDARLAWLLSDMLRFVAPGPDARRLSDAFRDVTSVDPRRDPAFADSAWLSITNHLIAWDLRAPPGYRELKAQIFTPVEPGWRPFFSDPDSAIDWRLVSWGGVPIDDRAAGDDKPCPQGCIPALDDPPLTPAGAGGWYPDRRVVFGVVVGGVAVALPRNIMEVHEMLNLSIGGRRLGIPYCTLCSSAQAYFTDRVRGQRAPLVLRTSGLLSRSNKVMYDLRTRSVFDTFSGKALSGPLHDAGVMLSQTSVVVSTWAAWKRAHPATLILRRDGGVGRRYPLDPLQGRDDNGPIFPVGDVDPRLPVQAQVAGVAIEGARPVAFGVEQARAALVAGKRVAVGQVELVADAGGLRARLRDGRAVAVHQSFWFAWSQFHPDTALWTPQPG